MSWELLCVSDLLSCETYSSASSPSTCVYAGTRSHLEDGTADFPSLVPLLIHHGDGDVQEGGKVLSTESKREKA